MTRRRVGLLLVAALVLAVIGFLRHEAPARRAPAAAPAGDAGPVQTVRAGSWSAGVETPPAPPEVDPSAAPEPIPAPPVPDSVAAAYAGNPQFVRACFDTLAAADVEHVEVRGRIGSVARHSAGPRGFVDEVEVALPDGSPASESSVHCFAAAANSAMYGTPPQGPVKFELTLERPGP